MSLTDTPTDRLGPDDTGRWIIRTETGTSYLWDLDALTAQRVASACDEALPYDGVTVEIVQVDSWPRVGSRAFYWFQDPRARWHHWRLTSNIESLTPLEPEP